MKVLVVELPAKAKTINKYLGRDYEVLASFGHIRDLPAKDGSVDPDDDFRMLWEVDPKSGKRVSDIAKALKGAEKLILATDPDREGEAISWHVVEALKEKRALKDTPFERVTFNAITKDAVQSALRQPRQIDQALVDAYMARRALDYLVGFTLSPVLWRKLPGARSAGRVQSVALRLVCDRELEIEKFVAREYWSLVATLATKDGGVFEARLVGADGRKIARLDIGTGAEAEAFRRDLELATFGVAKVEAKPAKRHPYAPFTTSTLQQEASRKLGLAPAQTMRVAQRLYEGVDIGGETVGLITYMRTDGIDMAPEAIAAARRVIAKEYGERYLPGVPRRYQNKAKNAQEAHEAIRPTDMGRLPSHVRKHLDPEQARLYELIWIRTVASQMESAELERTTVDIAARVGPRNLDLRATGQVIKFDGFLTLYREDRDDPDPAADGDDDEGRLPPMSAGDPLERRRIEAGQHFTEPPPRYSEASLVKRMEELGIGRPSTYASILAVLREREYVRLEKKRLVAEDKGLLVIAFLESFFKQLVAYDFTADLEEQLDRISNSEIDWKQVLRNFWRDFAAAVGETKDLRTTEILDALNDLLAPHIFPPKARRRRPARLPELRQRPAVAQARQVRRLHRLLELPRMPLHPPADGVGRGRGGELRRRGHAGREAPRRGPGDRPCRDAARRPLRHVPPARRGGREGRQAEALVAAAGRRSCGDRPRTGAAAAGPAAAGRDAPGVGRSRSSSASAATAPTSSTPRPTPTSRRTTTCWRSARTARSTSSSRRKAAPPTAAAASATPAARSARSPAPARRSWSRPAASAPTSPTARSTQRSRARSAPTP